MHHTKSLHRKTDFETFVRIYTRPLFWMTLGVILMVTALELSQTRTGKQSLATLMGTEPQTPSVQSIGALQAARTEAALLQAEIDRIKANLPELTTLMADNSEELEQRIALLESQLSTTVALNTPLNSESNEALTTGSLPEASFAVHLGVDKSLPLMRLRASEYQSKFDVLKPLKPLAFFEDISGTYQPSLLFGPFPTKAQAETACISLNLKGCSVTLYQGQGL